MAPDQQVLQHGCLLEQLDVLKGSGNAQGGNGIGRKIVQLMSVEQYSPLVGG